MGSPEFAVPSLKTLADHYPVVGVVTQPDRRAGRGRRLTPPAVKTAAQHLGLQVIQPGRLKDPEAMQQLEAWAPDLIVVAAFGQILRPEVLDLPRLGCINVHASLLPRWRGAAPIQAAILHGDLETGITLMKMDAGLDTGPMLKQEKIPIYEQDTAGSLSEKLATLSARILLETFPEYLAGKLQPIPQQDELATFAPRLEKSAGQLDFYQPAVDLARRVRAFNPWPGTYTTWEGQIIKIHHAHPVFRSLTKPGELDVHEGKPAIGAGDGLLVLDLVQPSGKQPMPGEQFLRGARTWPSNHR